MANRPSADCALAVAAPIGRGSTVRIPAIQAAILLALAVPASAAPITLSVTPASTLAAAITTANADPLNSYTLTLAPGIYLNDFAPAITRPLTIEGTGATLSATVEVPNQKGLLLTTASLFVRGLTIAGAFVSNALGGNAAGIRDQSTGPTTLQLENVTLQGNQNGILTAGSANQEYVIVKNSTFRDNGNASANDGSEHALYVGDAASLSISGSTFCGTVGQGHNIKSRAAQTTITDTTSYEGVAGGPCASAGNASRGIDIPNGGVAYLENVNLLQGAGSPNSGMMEFGVEGIAYAVNSLTMQNVAFTSSIGGTALQWFGGTAPCTQTGVTFSGLAPTPCPAGTETPLPPITEPPIPEIPATDVPEPTPLAILSTALLAFAFFRRNSRSS